MRELSVFMEINGSNEYVGRIVGTDSADACFIYADAYLAKPEQCAISIGLPLQEKQFDAKRTRIFFEGLLPEGFTRRCVAERMHLDSNDYLSILAELGRECLGAIKILDVSDKEVLPEYRRLSAEEKMTKRYFLQPGGMTEDSQIIAKC